MINSEKTEAIRRTEIFNAAVLLFEGNKDKAKRWINHPVKGLNGKHPADMSVSHKETQITLELIARLEHGILL